MAKFLTRACGMVGLRGTVNLMVSNNRDLRELNSRFRGKRMPTDVLSFPPAANLKNFAGDIAISAEMAAQNGRDLGHSIPLEIKVLALHGILHLAGYDHERDRGEMERKEAQLRRSLRLPGGLIERNNAAKVSVRSVGAGQKSAGRGVRAKSKRSKSNP